MMNNHGVGFSYNCLLCLLLLQCFRIGVNACAFRCGDGSCIDTYATCNGQRDCTDGSDETREVCAVMTCRNALGLDELSAEQSFGLGGDGMSFDSSFRCEYGGCISINFKCNGISNCADGSDETAEACKDTNEKNVMENLTARTRVMRRRISAKAHRHPRQLHTPTTAPDPSPPVVFLDPGRPSPDDFDCLPPNCRCPLPGLDHFCLPCGEIADLNATCRSLDDEAVCHAMRAHDVAFEVLSCGTQSLMTTAPFSRMAGSCVDPLGMVPSMTLAYVNCWNVSSQIMRCHSDGYWRVIGAQMSGDHDIDFIETQPMKQLCQPYYVNSQVCGRRSRYKISGGPLRLDHFRHQENRWPMVMGLLKKEARYVCSATLISPRFLLTAAQCVMVSMDSRDQAMDVRNLMVQLDTRNIVRVIEIIIHPDYQHDGLKPLNDLALVKLELPIVFHSKLYPACVDLDGSGFLLTSTAVTFNRGNGVSQHRYREVHQQIDTRCFDRMDSCSGLQIAATQFCGHDIEKKYHLEGGSSGGPFLQNLGSDVSEEWTVTGVVSFNIDQQNCNQQYTVFTAINNYKTWITEIVHKEI